LYTVSELAILLWAGASNSFIRGPYIVEGIIYGLIAGFLSFLIWIPFINLISPYVANFVPELNLKIFLNEKFLTLLGYQLASGIVLGIISSVVAIRRYLHI